MGSSLRRGLARAGACCPPGRGFQDARRPPNAGHATTATAAMLPKSERASAPGYAASVAGDVTVHPKGGSGARWARQDTARPALHGDGARDAAPRNARATTGSAALRDRSDAYQATPSQMVRTGLGVDGARGLRLVSGLRTGDIAGRAVPRTPRLGSSPSYAAGASGSRMRRSGSARQ